MRYLRYLGIVALLGLTPAMAQDTGTAPPADMETIITMAEGGNVDAALEALETLLAAEPNNLEALYYRGLLQLEQGDTASARDAFLSIIEQYPEVVEALNNLALTYAREGDYERARRNLLSAIGRDPDYATAQANLGDLYLRMAADAYERANELYQNDPAADAAAAATRAKLEFLEQMFEGR